MAASVPSSFVRPWLPKSAASPLLLKNCSIVDVVEGKTRPSSTIYIRDGVIKSIVSDDDSSFTPDSEHCKEIDLGGKFVCPGLIDCHVHVSAVPGEVDLRHILATPEQESLLRMTFVCRDILCRGFTTARDCGGAPYALKQACSEWLVPGPRLFISGHALSQTGGHGDFRSAHDHAECASGFVSGLGRVCDGIPECMRVARDELRCGADFIKIMASGGVASPTDKIDSNQFSPEEIRAIVQVAENVHTYVTCHAYTAESIQIAIQNGVKGVEHGNLLDRQTAKLMAEKGCYLTQTLVTYQALADPANPQILSADSAAKNVAVLKSGLDALKIANEEGVTICYGSDLLGPLGYSQLQGFTICSEVLSPLEVLRTATINAAKMLGQEDRLGQIKTGFCADLLVLDANPLDDIATLEKHKSNLLLVLKEGRTCLSRIPELSGLLDGFVSL